MTGLKMKTIILALVAFCCCFATCKPEPNNLPEAKWIEFPDITALHTPDSLKYLLPILDSVFKKDQYYRNTYNDFSKQTYSKELLRKTQAKWDKENLETVEMILQKHGWLGHKQIGVKGSTAIFFVLQHADIKTQLKYYSDIEKAYEQKNIISTYYAMFVDRINLRTKKPQKFGTQLIPVKKSYELFPLENADSVIIWRKKAGMPEPFEDYLKRFKLKWDVEEYKSKHAELVKKYLKS
jgi:hypothetical protein